jgi:D-amino peptidase
MKLLIAVDMEGITGVTHSEQTNPSLPEYHRFRKLMTGDVNAAIQGAWDAHKGEAWAFASSEEKTPKDDLEIIIADGHWNGTNILIEDLDERARINSGSPSPFAMVEGIEKGVQAVFFVGYHARMGTANAIIDHTWSSTRVFNIWLNGKLIGETGLNAAVCGHFGAPVLLVTGDQSVAAEAQEWMPGVETAIIKQATGRNSAECLPPEKTCEIIRQAARRAMHQFYTNKTPELLKVETPVKMEIEFIYTDMAERASILSGVTRLDGRRLSIESADMVSAYINTRTLIGLANR